MQRGDLAADYEAFFRKRLKELAPAYEQLFSSFFQTELPDSVRGVHVELFENDNGFSVVVYSIPMEAFQADHSRVRELNDNLEKIEPVMSFEERDRFLVWERPLFGRRRLAPQQPAFDSFFWDEVAVEWLNAILKAARGSFGRTITIASHDVIPKVEI